MLAITFVNIWFYSTRDRANYIACLLLFYTIAMVFQLYQGTDMIHETKRKKPENILLATQGIFNLPYNIDMVWEELAFDDAGSYTQQANRLQDNNGIRTPVPKVTNPTP